ncbi:hypothetical protein ANANG_G00251030 [Anguilla anguilla]|uniref:Uncharacterized protein n=1 Tax=Anguilla anguilla TaxID=7936 RepID=A0A0E9WXL3_ANGAN|nr:hypothetical protein ANANG_G00251030 [Anguilla anguilla]
MCSIWLVNESVALYRLSVMVYRSVYCKDATKECRFWPNKFLEKFKQVQQAFCVKNECGCVKSAVLTDPDGFSAGGHVSHLSGAHSSFPSALWVSRATTCMVLRYCVSLFNIYVRMFLLNLYGYSDDQTVQRPMKIHTNKIVQLKIK